ncbi:MAG: EamA family transporter [Candidatus Aenigmatarchaeota archaeon]
MDWLFFAILSPLLLAISNLVDKFVISKTIKHPMPYAMMYSFIQMFLGIFLLAFFKIQFVYPASFIAIAAGGIWTIASYTYVKSMMMEEATKVMSLFFVAPIFTTFFAAIFLKEIFTPFKYVGIGLLVLSAILISHKKISGRMRILPALKIILLGVPLYSMISILEKFSLTTLDYISLNFWIVGGAGSVAFLLLASDKIRLDFGTQFYVLKNKGFLKYTVINEIIAFFAFMAGFIAISETYVSYVSGLGSIQPFFLFLFSLILSLIFPHFIKERFNRQTLVVKLVSVLLIIAGGWLIVS